MSGRRPNMYDELRGVPVEGVALALGMTWRGRRLGPCPACGATTGGTDDKARGPVSVVPGGMKWKCHACGEGGDAAELVKRHAVGGTWDAARELAEEIGLVDRPGGDGRHPARRDVRRPPPPGPGPREALPPKYPTADEVAVLLDVARPPVLVPDVAEWLEGRGFEREDVERLGASLLALAAPADDCTAHDAPWKRLEWARVGRRRWLDGWRLLLPCYNASGEVVTVKARWTRAESARVKEAAPAGYEVGGTVYADESAQAMLREGERGMDLVVVEGGPAWLRYAVDALDRPDVAVVGVYSGSGWRGLVEVLVSRSRRVVVATDQDAGGGKHADPWLRVAADLKVPAVRRTW